MKIAFPTIGKQKLVAPKSIGSFGVTGPNLPIGPKNMSYFLKLINKGMQDWQAFCIKHLEEVQLAKEHFIDPKELESWHRFQQQRNPGS